MSIFKTIVPIRPFEKPIIKGLEETFQMIEHLSRWKLKLLVVQSHLEGERHGSHAAVANVDATRAAIIRSWISLINSRSRDGDWYRWIHQLHG